MPSSLFGLFGGTDHECPILRVEGAGLDVIRAPKAGILGNQKAASTTFCISQSRKFSNEGRFVKIQEL
jgi:hypothetical protein